MNGCDNVKYLLAFDTKDYNPNQERFIIIPNYLIGKDLDANNNLKALCYFTCKFEDESELKETIIKLFPKYRDCSGLRLVLVCSEEANDEKKIFANRVLYSNASRYFDMNYLAKEVTNKLQNREFLTKLFELYKDYDYLSRYLNSLYTAVISDDIQKIKKLVNLFLDRLLFGKAGLEYDNFYKLIVCILDSDSCSINALFNSAGDTELSDDTDIEAVEFERDWLKHRARLRQQNGGYY